MRSLVLLEDQVNIGTSKKTKALSPRSEIKDVAFVEFAVDKNHAGDLALLNNLLMAIDFAVREPGESKTRVIRLVDRKPEGSA